tara:strand:- start:2734 stop:2910 length:177 start_codon:yes stop_codon:yes gene_type:complete
MKHIQSATFLSGNLKNKENGHEFSKKGVTERLLEKYKYNICHIDKANVIKKIEKNRAI